MVSPFCRRTTTVKGPSVNSASRQRRGRTSTALTRGEAVLTPTSSFTRFKLNRTSTSTGDCISIIISTGISTPTRFSSTTANTRTNMCTPETPVESRSCWCLIIEIAAECEAEGSPPEHWQRTRLGKLQRWQLLQVNLNPVMRRSRE